MAIYYFRNAGVNWGDAANWSLTDGGGATGAVPTAADDVLFTANSGNCTVNASARVCKTLNFTGYTNTITMTNNITVSGNVTLGVGMGIAGAGTLIVNATSTFTSNGKTWSTPLQFNGTITITLADNLSVSGLFSGGTSGTTTINGTFSITCSGGVTFAGSNITQGTGTTTINLTGGTCSVSASGTGGGIALNTLNLNGNLTIGTTFFINSPNFNYVGGVITTTGSTLSTQPSVTTLNWNLNGVNWETISFNVNTITLLSNLTCVNLVKTGTSSNIINGFTLNVSGNLNLSSGGVISGTTNIVLNGTGTWTSSGSALQNNLTINTVGTITVSGTVVYNTGTLTYTAGTVVTTGSTLSTGATVTFNTSGMTWNNITMNNATVTLTSQLNISGTFSVITTSSTVNGGTINCTGSATSSTLNGTGTLLMSGTGTLTGNYGSINLTINTVGTITITGTLNKGGGTFTYTAGTVSVGTSTLLMTGSPTLNISGVTWNNVTINDQTTVTLSANLNVGGILTLGSSSNFCTINGAFNINANGNVTVGGTATITGTTTLVFAGTGTWSNSSTAPIRLNTTINTAGTLTISGTVYYNTGTLTYTSGTVTTTGSTLSIAASTTLNTSGMSWNNITFSATNTATLTSNLNVNGLLTIGGGGGSTTTFNGTFDINCSGGFFLNGNTQQGTGTTTVNLLGGILTGGTVTHRLNTNINGNITITGTLYYNNGTLTYLSGQVNTAGSTLILASTPTLNTSGMYWNNVTGVCNLTSDINIFGLFSTFNGGFSGAFNVNLYGGISIGAFLQNSTVSVPTINLYGGVFCPTAPSDGFYFCNINILGNVTLGNIVLKSTNTIRYISGITKGTNNSSLSILINGNTIINADKLNGIKTITIGGALTVTMNKFFSGSALIPTRIQSSTTTNYIITFQDGFEKITKFTRISNCTVTNRSQLLCITDNSNKGGNVGIRYINQSPNGIAKNASTAQIQTVYGLPSYYEADPALITR